MLNNNITPEFIKYITKVVYNAAGAHNLEDHVQDAILRVMENAHLFDPSKGSFKSWASTVARNYTRNRWKAERIRTHNHVSSVADDDREIPVYDTIPTPEGRDDDRKQLAVAMGLLSPEDHHLMEMVVEGMGQVEIGKALGLSQGAVSKRIAKVQATLRNLMEGR
jgi:RNA polymerase sigma-70 factor (ECF subfamily)